MGLNADWMQRDLNVLWHPCTQMKDHERLPVIPIRRGEGVWLEDFEGKRYIDAVKMCIRDSLRMMPFTWGRTSAMRNALVRPGSSVFRVTVCASRVTIPTSGVCAGGGASLFPHPERAEIATSRAGTSTRMAGVRCIALSS